eukprot:TRINITY_DN22693_c1_g2_i2.p1 TRINITY_DN22693_c1_g2~~TRINITY_DN22693_c1_g2_i2.p1  ORF type:complete len:222 (+),score=20.95 TRINITY_DN22693_c1_g2_i2:105-770(+)
MPLIEEVDEAVEVDARSQERSPFEEWIAARLAGGASSVDLVDLVHEIGAADFDGPEHAARRCLSKFARLSEIHACEVVRVMCLKRKLTPPFPFSTWLRERKLCGATTVQVKFMLGLQPSTGVEEAVTVVEEFLSENKVQSTLHQGLRGQVQRYDREGDALIAFDGIERPQWVSRVNFQKLLFVEAESRWGGLQKLAEETFAWDILYRKSISDVCCVFRLPH